MRCKLCPPPPCVETELNNLVCEGARKGRPLPRFVLVGYNTYSNLRRSLIGTCNAHREWEDMTVATPVGMITLAVDETVAEGMKLIYYAKHMRPGG